MWTTWHPSSMSNITVTTNVIIVLGITVTVLIIVLSFYLAVGPE